MPKDLMYDLESIRKKMKKRKGGGSNRDPNEWRADKADAGKSLKWMFFILPPIESMDLWYYEHGNHYIDNKVLECPRLHDGDQCPLCQFGFDLMSETKDKAERSAIAKKFLSSSRYAVNIYFPPVKSVPADLRGKVMWYSMPATIYNICEEVIMRDPPEDDAIEVEPHGIFYDPANALPFILEAKKKGDYNSYESSHFQSKAMPISKKEDKILEILEKRHDIPSMFDSRDVDALQAIVDKLNGEGGSSIKTEKVNKKEEKEDKEDEEMNMEEEMEEEMEEAASVNSDDSDDSNSDDDAEIEDDSDAEIEDHDEDLDALLAELNSDK